MSSAWARRTAGLKSFFLVALCLLAWGCQKPAPPRPIGLEAGLDFLRRSQDDDGAWHSQPYQDMAEGPELTPYVVKALHYGGTAPPANALNYLENQSPREGLIYPVYTASGMLLSGADKEGKWRSLLLEFQATEKLGYAVEDPQYGGWGYAMKPPQKPESGVLPPLSHSNLPSTLFALGGLSLSGAGLDAEVREKALKFVERCQNFPEGDGGFCASPSDPSMNKAGDFTSYGSATSDGLRALLRCGLKPDDARVVAARAWVDKNLSVQQHPGEFPSGRLYDRDSLYLYYCWSTAHALHALTRAGADLNVEEREWLGKISAHLLTLQKKDGSWSNPASATREDEPLIATPMVVATLMLAKMMSN